MDDNNQDDGLLEKLLRGAYSGERGEFRRPNDELISACLMGTADQEQRSQFHSALLASANFRTEMRELARQILETEEIGDLRVTPENKTTTADMAHENSRESNLFRLIWPVAAIAAALLAIVYWPGTERVSDRLKFARLEQPVDKSRLRLFSPRGTDSGGEPELYATADSAAIGEFKYLLQYTDGEFTLAPPAERPGLDVKSRKVVLKLFNESGELLQQVEAEVPVTPEGKAQTQAWALTLPSLEIGAIDLDKDTVEVAWPSKSEKKACVTFTYQHDSGLYGSIIGFTLDLGGKY